MKGKKNFITYAYPHVHRDRFISFLLIEYIDTNKFQKVKNKLTTSMFIA